MALSYFKRKFGIRKCVKTQDSIYIPSHVLWSRSGKARAAILRMQGLKIFVVLLSTVLYPNVVLVRKRLAAETSFRGFRQTQNSQLFRDRNPIECSPRLFRVSS